MTQKTSQFSEFGCELRKLVNKIDWQMQIVGKGKLVEKT
jgi:hypothetical protein